jgi:hypothetical protein
MDLIDVLQEEFEKRRAKNSRYSLRAFAQNIGVQSATLSAVLKRKRALPAATRLDKTPGRPGVGEDRAHAKKPVRFQKTDGLRGR